MFHLLLQFAATNESQTMYFRLSRGFLRTAATTSACDELQTATVGRRWSAAAFVWDQTEIERGIIHPTRRLLRFQLQSLLCLQPAAAAALWVFKASAPWKARQKIHSWKAESEEESKESEGEAWTSNEQQAAIENCAGKSLTLNYAN